MVVWLWFWPRERWERLRKRMSYTQRYFAAVQALPALVISAWLVVAILALAGKWLDRLGEAAVIPALSPFLLFFTALMFSWPLAVIPPGARSPEAIADAQFVNRHPLWAIGIILVLIALGVLLGSQRHG